MKNNILPSVKFNYLKVTFLSIMLSFFALTTATASGGDDGKPFDVSQMINHHILDAHEWHFYTTTDEAGVEHHVSLPLPIILYTNGQIDVFSSGEFYHSENNIVTKGDYTYKLEHEHVKVVDAQGNVQSDIHPLDLSITKNVASMMIAAFLLLIIGFSIRGAYKKREGQAPKGMQSFFEPIIVYLRDDLAIPNIGEHKYKKYFPYLLTLFFFIWFNNLLGLMPTGANTSGNIAFTMALAALTLIITNISGNKHYWKHIFAMPGVPIPLLPIMIVVELIGIFTKPIALMIRLFANITAGHTIILALIGIIFIFKQALLGIPVVPFVFAMMCLELFVALLQAYIFTLLTALFIGQAIADDHH
ncbi:F0F1 ATP synthase subunit A [Bernardetia sp. OM2101]|uniref:F0F1 ATP synthase subunit A n=1 Tax=Bernardetia sp. OM2101 TaxID=3344876 RepID=UPI0035D09DB7